MLIMLQYSLEGQSVDGGIRIAAGSEVVRCQTWSCSE